MKESKEKKRLSFFLGEIKRKYVSYLIYFISIFITLIFFNVLIVYNTCNHEKSIKKIEMENISKIVVNIITNELDSAAAYGANIFKNTYIQNYIERKYETELDYIIQYQDFKDRNSLNSTSRNGYQYTIYVNNSSIVSGGFFQKIIKAQNSNWYRQYIYSKDSPFLFFEFDKGESSYSAKKRRFLLLRDLDYSALDKTQKILKIQIDYDSLYSKLLDMNFKYSVYVTSNGNEVISNTEESHPGVPYRIFNIARENCYVKDFSVYGSNLCVCVKNDKMSFLLILEKHSGLFLTLMLLNLVFVVMVLFFVSHAVYRNRIKEQEMIVARQTAELIALKGQINPHFLFNILESIRMHSVIKEEKETANMIQSLAHIQRQYVDWGVDDVTIEQEMECVKDYLELQKYRFGDRLNYSLECDDYCRQKLIPKLSIVTFVENACVHGMEKKASHCWVFVRALKANDCIEIEIEDTGIGMSESKKMELKERIENASMELLTKKGRVGIVNACLRLKIATDNKVKFLIESEEMEGTVFTIRIPFINDSAEEGVSLC